MLAPSPVLAYVGILLIWRVEREQSRVLFRAFFGSLGAFH